ncbi:MULTISPECIES: aminodeoxychorismate synthase component I [unclassified Microbacterium]|uniref:aminodeoxychorismate synthase component I n=1 Tax=unclassified Microbacterium TaxID=2609290 RepID=UPI00300FC8A1
MRTLLIDNYDSFTYNLVHQLVAAGGAEPVVVPNDWTGWDPSVLDGFDNVVLSPGPGDPRVPGDFGICAEAIRAAAGRRMPLLGVCLGHQGIAHAFGARVSRAPEPRHGRPSLVSHDGTGPFRGILSPTEVIRYHSLRVEDLPAELVATAWADDGVVMGLRHRDLPLWGVQFHPESIGTPDGTRMVENFAAFTREHRTTVPPARGVPADARATAPDVPPPASVIPPSAPAHRELPWHGDAARLFAALYGDAPQAVWLDGNRPGDPRARFSILGGGADLPTATAEVRSGSVTVQDDRGTAVHERAFFDWLDDELAADPGASVPGIPFALGWIGWLGYELRAECGSPHRRSSAVPDAAVVRLDEGVVIDHERSRIHLLSRRDDGWIERTAALVERVGADPGDTGDIAAEPGAATDAAPFPTLRARHGRAAYLRLIAEAQELIAAGETYEACLTNMLTASVPEGTAPIDPLGAYLALRTQNPAPFGSFLRIGGVSVLSTSPERFVRITADGDVESSPIKGTRPRGDTPAEDEAIRLELAGAEKDRAENLMIVDLVRHDLGRTAARGSVRVDGLFRVETYATAHQLVSTVRSRLGTASPVACVRAAFPPGSMTGAPKQRTMAILDRLEQGPRGVYSGAVGYFSRDGAVDLSVVIRTAVVHPGGLDYGVGGAIVALSDPDEEYGETVVKARPLLRWAGASFPTG